MSKSPWKPGKPKQPSIDWLMTIVIGILVAGAAILCGSLLANFLAQ